MYCICCNVQLCGFFIVFAFVAGISPEKSGFIPIVVVVGYRFWRLLFWFWIEYLSFLAKFGCLGDDEKGNAVRIFADFRSPDAVDCPGHSECRWMSCQKAGDGCWEMISLSPHTVCPFPVWSGYLANS